MPIDSVLRTRRTWPPIPWGSGMIASKPLIATACLSSLNALACKPLGLDTEVQFERGASTLTASNVRKLAHWHAVIAENFHGKGPIWAS